MERSIKDLYRPILQARIETYLPTPLLQHKKTIETFEQEHLPDELRLWIHSACVYLQQTERQLSVHALSGYSSLMDRANFRRTFRNQGINVLQEIESFEQGLEFKIGSSQEILPEEITQEGVLQYKQYVFTTLDQLYLQKALAQNDGKMNVAARYAGIDRCNFRRLARRVGVVRAPSPPSDSSFSSSQTQN